MIILIDLAGRWNKPTKTISIGFREAVELQGKLRVKFRKIFVHKYI